MLKKYYILALTFLCLFLGQVSYGLNINEGHEDDWLAEAIEAGATISVYDSLEEYAAAHNIDGAIDTNGDGTFSTSEIASYMFGFEISEVTTFAHETAYMLSNGDLLLLSSLLNEVVVVKASNNNNSSGSTDTTTTVPDPTDPPCIGCPDPCIGCDGDLPPVKEPCIKTCDSGYKLNMDTCECVLLPPCFGTVKDFETSNSFNSNTILNKVNSTIGDFGISTDIMDIIKQMDIFNPNAIAAGSDFLKFADDLGTIGDVGQVSMDVLKYLDEPSTQNLLKTVLDTAAITLSSAASLALSTIDYFKDSNGNSKLDLLLKAASDAIDRSIDCNLGLGIRNSVF